MLSGVVLGELEALPSSRWPREAVPTPLVLRSAHPTIYLAGADLAEIAALDGPSCADYARRGRVVLERLALYPAPTVAAVHGSCSGGGFDLGLACDWIVAGGAAAFSHPGVRRGLVTGWGGTVRLPVAIGRTAAGMAMGSAGRRSAATSSRREASRRSRTATLMHRGDGRGPPYRRRPRDAAAPVAPARSSGSPWLVAARAIIGSAAVP